MRLRICDAYGASGQLAQLFRPQRAQDYGQLPGVSRRRSWSADATASPLPPTEIVLTQMEPYARLTIRSTIAALT